MMESVKRLEHPHGTVVELTDEGFFRLVGEDANDSGEDPRNPKAVSLVLSEAELRWLVTTAGPAVLPRREPVR